MDKVLTHTHTQIVTRKCLEMVVQVYCHGWGNGIRDKCNVKLIKFYTANMQFLLFI